MTHVCADSPLLEVIVPMLVNRVHSRLKNWLQVQRHQLCNCIRILIVFDIKGSDSSAVRDLAIEIKHLTLNPSNLEILIGNHGSPGGARNQGLRHSVAPWVIFWDSDDEPTMDAFNILKRDLSRINDCIHVYQYQVYRENFDKAIETSNNRRIVDIARHPGLWRFAIPGHIARQFRFSEELMAEDVTYLVSILVSGLVEDFVFHKDTLYTYYRYQSGQLTTTDSALKKLDQSIKKLADVIQAGNERRFSSLAAAIGIFGFQCMSLMKRRPFEALRLAGDLLEVLGHFFFNCIYILKQSKAKNEDVKEVFIYGLGGLGNQLFQYSAARYLAKNAEKTILISDSGSPRMNKVGEPVIFDLVGKQSKSVESYSVGRLRSLFAKISNVLLRVNLSQKKSLNNFIVRGILSTVSQPILSLILKKNVSVLVCRGHGFTSFNNIRKSSVLLIGYFQSYEYANTIRTELQNSLKIIQREILSQRLHFDVEHPPSSLVVHVRRGDYLKERQIGCLSDQYFMNLVNHVLSTDMYNEVWFFVEDPGMADFLIKMNVANVHVFSSQFFDTIETLALMSMGAGFIISNSTFSWWGAFLNERQLPDSRKISPSPWYAKLEQPKRLIPNDWEKATSDWMMK